MKVTSLPRRPIAICEPLKPTKSTGLESTGLESTGQDPPSTDLVYRLIVYWLVVYRLIVYRLSTDHPSSLRAINPQSTGRLFLQSTGYPPCLKNPTIPSSLPAINPTNHQINPQSTGHPSLPATHLVGKILSEKSNPLQAHTSSVMLNGKLKIFQQIAATVRADAQ
jgi:hypothetical protein